MLERFKRDDDKGGSESGAVATTTPTDSGDAQMRAARTRPTRRPASHLHTRGRPGGATAPAGSSTDDRRAHGPHARRPNARRRGTVGGTHRTARRPRTEPDRRHADRRSTRPRPSAPRRAPSAASGRGPLTGEAMKTARSRQRDEFGGLNWGASFFGWLVAVGVGAIITGLLAAAGRGRRADEHRHRRRRVRSASAAGSRCWSR